MAAPDIARCEISDLPAEMCGHCTGAEERARAGEHHQVMPGSPWFRAGYPGRCSACGEDIRPGDKIRADGEGGGYCCRECGDADVLEELF